MHRFVPALLVACISCTTTRTATTRSPGQEHESPASDAATAIAAIESMSTRAPIVIAINLAAEPVVDTCHTELAAFAGVPEANELCLGRTAAQSFAHLMRLLLGDSGQAPLPGVADRGWFVLAGFEPLGVEIVADVEQLLGMALQNYGARFELVVPATDAARLLAALEALARKQGKPAKARLWDERVVAGWSTPAGWFVAFEPRPQAVRIGILTPEWRERGGVPSELLTAPLPPLLPHTPARHALTAVGDAFAVVHYRPWLLSDLHAMLELRIHGGHSLSTEVGTLITRVMGAAAFFPGGGSELDDHALVVRGDADSFDILHVASLTPRGRTAWASVESNAPLLSMRDPTTPVSFALRTDLGRAHELLPHPMLIDAPQDIRSVIEEQGGVSKVYALAQAPLATLRSAFGARSGSLGVRSIQLAGTLDRRVALAIRGADRDEVQALARALATTTTSEPTVLARGDESIGLVGFGVTPESIFAERDVEAQHLLQARMRLKPGPPDEIRIDYRVVGDALVGRIVAGKIDTQPATQWPRSPDVEWNSPFTQASAGETCLREAVAMLDPALAGFGAVPPAKRRAYWIDMLERPARSIACGLADPYTTARARHLLRVLGLFVSMEPGVAKRLCEVYDDEELCARARGER